MSSPVIGKIPPVFDNGFVDPKFLNLLSVEKPVPTVKYDGWNVIVVNHHGRYLALRRLDIQNTHPEISMVGWATESNLGGYPCIMFNITRLSIYGSYKVPCWVFDMNNIIKENKKISVKEKVIGYVIIDELFPNDSCFCCALVGINGTSNLKLWTATIEDTFFLKHNLVDASDLVPETGIRSFEILSRNFSDTYGFLDTHSVLVPHGISVIPDNIYETFIWKVEFFRDWFDNNRTTWSSIEGIVFWFPTSGKYYKINRRHVDLQEEWLSQVESSFFVLPRYQDMPLDDPDDGLLLLAQQMLTDLVRS